MDLRLLLPSKPLVFSPSRPRFPLQSLSRRLHSASYSNSRLRVSCSLQSEGNAVERSDSERRPKQGGLVVSGSDSAESPSIWKQMKEIALFAGPATGLWICGPLMSLIDTMVIGQSSSLELAALGNESDNFTKESLFSIAITKIGLLKTVNLRILLLQNTAISNVLRKKNLKNMNNRASNLLP